MNSLAWGMSYGAQLRVSQQHIDIQNIIQAAPVQDAMTVCRVLRKPTWFITMTTNAEWAEKQENLLPGQSATDRPNLVARVLT